MKRYEAKYNTTDPNTIIRTIAEMPITPAEAILKAEGLFYPVSDVLDQILEIESNPRNLDDIMVGNLEISSNNEIRFKPSLENPPIRSFPHKDNKITGCAEIHVPPQRTSSGKVQRGRYVACIS